MPLFFFFLAAFGPKRSANVERNQLISNLFAASSLINKSMQKGLELNIPEPMFNLSETSETIDLHQKKNLE